MDSTLPPIRSDVVAAQSAPRPTPVPPRIQFSEVLARGATTLVQGAESAVTSLPGAPLVATALRGGPSVPAMQPSHPVTTPEGPGAGAAGTLGGGLTGAGAGSAGTGTSGIDQTLAQSQDMNMYYLQIQEQVNQENRTFSTLSNVLKAEHDTVKTAIGNIR